MGESLLGRWRSPPASHSARFNAETGGLTREDVLQRGERHVPELQLKSRTCGVAVSAQDDCRCWICRCSR